MDVANEITPNDSSSLPVPAPIAKRDPQPRDKFTFLEEHTSSVHHHADKSLYQHLFNVYSYLKSQSYPDSVCDAGLFHSVYGTEFFHFKNAAITRDVVRSIIGDYAEDLAYTFCMLRKDRCRCIVFNTPGWNLSKHLDMCRLEYANLWDAKDFKDLRRKMEVVSQAIELLEIEQAG